MSTQRSFASDRPRGAGLGAIRRHWLLIAVTVALCVAVAVVYSKATPSRYQAQADLAVTPTTDSTNVFLGMNVLTDPTTAPQIVGRTLTTNKVAEGVIDRLDLRLTPRALLKKVTISPIQQSGIVAIKAKDENPQVAANIANAFPAILIQQQTAQFHQEMAAATDRMRSQLRTSGLDAGERVAIADRKSVV